MAAAVRGVSAMLLGLCWLGSTPARAQTPAQPAPTTAEAHPFVAEFHTGLKDPLGKLGLALVYDPGHRFSAGLGVGLDSVHEHVEMAASLFGRARLLRLGNFSLDTGAILSVGTYEVSRTYSPPARIWKDRLTWRWSPDYRLTGTLGAGWTGQRWSLRLETGLAYHINQPKCSYRGVGAAIGGDCDSDYIADEYHFSSVPGRVAMSFSLTLGYRLGMEDAIRVGTAGAGSDHRSPRTALHLSAWSTAVPVVLGAAMFKLGIANNHENLAFVGIPIIGLGLSYGPSVGYAYAGEPWRAWGLGSLRAISLALGSLFLFGVAMNRGCDGCSEDSNGGMELAGYALIGASLISAVYDVMTAPKAAERANARHGLGNISLLPAPIAGSKSVGPGLVLGGQF